MHRLLSGLDALDASAPSQIKRDFHLFTRAEYSILEPSSPKALPEAQLTGRATQSFLHVRDYLAATCGIS